MNWSELLPLALILVLSIISKNTLVALPSALLLVMLLLGIRSPLPWIEKNGIQGGIFLLTLAILVPLGTGKVTLLQLYESCTSLKGFIAVATGIFVAWAGSLGVGLMKMSPDVVTSLLVGTIIGVCFFGGIAVGPLIAAGLVYLLLKLLGIGV